MKLRTTASDNSGKDAEVFVPQGTDLTKPVGVILVEHGWRSSAEHTIKEFGFDKQMPEGQYIVVVNEWQGTPGAGAGDKGRNWQGNLASPHMYDRQLQEILDKTPGLPQTKISDLTGVHLVSFSAGYVPSASILGANGRTGQYDNPAIVSKLKTLALFDTTYSGGFDEFIHNNRARIANGNLRVMDIYRGSTTGKYSTDIAQEANGMPAASVHIDQAREIGGPVLSAAQLAQYNMVVQFWGRTNGKNAESVDHPKIPANWFGPIVGSIAQREQMRR
jgi:hypothetical protein